jgi:hypothetical protein
MTTQTALSGPNPAHPPRATKIPKMLGISSSESNALSGADVIPRQPEEEPAGDAEVAVEAVEHLAESVAKEASFFFGVGDEGG